MPEEAGPALKYRLPLAYPFYEPSDRGPVVIVDRVFEVRDSQSHRDVRSMRGDHVDSDESTRWVARYAVNA